ncbi:MAG: sulfatase-like hydrolase/transferase [Roseibium sp.]|uniref:sulfatase-like hydrolase/transferase n=1 Tax=Roseibium sp. TaxID=1936156 RepID=UPI0026089A9D|nr:sulfatase-like hydrolase/transferase [Roseibium sp.]MCV0424382.1 sulfatase-like hydrolase/transferase [Roseibium sp.]
MSRLVRFLFDFRVVLTCVIVGMIAIAVAERNLATLPMAYFIACSVISLLALLTARPITSIYFGFALLGTIAFISYIKMKWMSLAPNIIDIYYFVLNAGTLSFLMDSFLPYIIATALLLASSLFILLFVGYFEKGKAGIRRWSLAVFLVSLSLTVWSQPKQFDGIGELMRYRYVTSVFRSLHYLPHLNDPVPLLDRLATTTKTENVPEKVAEVSACETHSTRPDLIVVQSESVVPPAIFHDKGSPDVLDKAFGGDDGILRPLQVETFSGGTWVTTAGFATSLVISELEWLKSYSNFLLEGRIDFSLAQRLSDCGYHTVYLSPLPYSFVNEGNFIQSIGFEAFLDQQDMGAATNHETDAFYYQAALDYLAEHHQTDDRPVFMVILTMSAHSPWDYRLYPDRHIEGEPFDENPDVNEYIRRLAISRTDLAEFQEQLEEGPDARPTVLLDFGDHQPGLTLPYWQTREGETPLANSESGAYLTYFQFLSAGTELSNSAPVFEKLDVQYLAPTLMEVAGLPLGRVYEDLSAMRDICDGRFKTCPVPGRIEAHYRCRFNDVQCTSRRTDTDRNSETVAIPGSGNRL